MIQYGVLFVTGFLFLYQLLVLWGWSAGLVSPGPYYALLGGLVIFPLSAAATLWRPRIAAWSALAGGALGMVWPITALVLGFSGPTEFRVDVLNIGDTVYLIRNGTGIGVFTTQFGPPRGFFGGLKKVF